MLSAQIMAQGRVEMPSEGKLTAGLPSVSDPTADAVSSLRALALSTMRLKRRRDASQQQHAAGPSRLSSDSHRPPVATIDVDMLDYGSEEQLTTQQDDKTETITVSNSVDNLPQADYGQGDAREEGEISDEEDDSTLASAVTQSNGISEGNTRHVSPLAPILSRTPLSPVPQPTELPNTASQNQISWNNWVPQPDQVRPGLKMSMEQFNLVKELVLDLLGWGVSPEYLVDCGLTRESVFYSFTELNLRLPNNLDVSGLIPLPLSTSTASSSQDTISITSTPLSHTPEAQIAPSRRTSLSHPSIKIPDPHEDASSAPNISPVASDVTNLNNMEAQRRLELQARKAVLASRKKKNLQASVEARNAIDSSSIPPSTGEPSWPATISEKPVSRAPTDAVDSFLKSMLESSSLPSSSLTPTHLQESETPGGKFSLDPGFGSGSATPLQPNDADTDGIPGLGSYRAQSTSIRQVGPVSPEIAPLLSSNTSTIEASNDALEAEEKGNLPVSSALINARMKSVASMNFALTHKSPPATNGKRGTKRPVAMDFVEDDRDVPGGSRRPSPSLPARPAVRRKIGGFAGLGGFVPRRCVINLSDSEDESAETISRQRSKSPDGAIINLRAPRAGPSRPTSRNVVLRPSSAQASTKPSTTSTPTPESLMEKEEQIRRMRELIAETELKRLRKLAEKSRGGVTMLDLPSTASTVMRMSKSPPLFDDPLVIEHYDQEGTSLEGATMAEAENEAVSAWSLSETNSACDQAEEDAVIHDLITTGSANNSVSSTPPDTKLTLPDEDNIEDSAPAPAKFKLISAGALSEALSDMGLSPTDAEPLSSSAEVPDASAKGAASFSPYSSPFFSYPLLRSRARVVTDLTSASALPSRDASRLLGGNKVVIPDLRPLRVAVVLRETNDTGRRICQYEIPGGGLCRDKTCTDVHLADFEPDDHETARYLLESMPALRKFNESEVMDQLLQARQKKSNSKFTISSTSRMPTFSSGNTLESTVADALAALTSAG